MSSLKGGNRIRTGDEGFADLCLTTWLYHQLVKSTNNYWLEGRLWDSNPRMSDPQTDVLTKLHQYRQNIQLSRDSRNRTHNDGFGDRSYTI